MPCPQPKNLFVKMPRILRIFDAPFVPVLREDWLYTSTHFNEKDTGYR